MLQHTATMITNGPPEADGNYAPNPPQQQQEDPDAIQPASDSPETASSGSNRVIVTSFKNHYIEFTY